MAIADDFSVASNGDIRHVSGTTTYTVLQLHRYLQNLADNASVTGDDILDISDNTPSDRATDNIITLINGYNIDDTAAQYLYDGSITQDNGDTVYSGLRVLGAVNNVNTQLMVIQDNELYQFTPDPAAPFWGDQSTGGYNGIAASGILMRCLIKSRVDGVDIDGKRVRVQARHWGDSYDFFNVTLGSGESVAAISTTPDAQNDTSQGTVTAYVHVTNTEGFQTIDLNNGNGAREYYSKWTYGVDTSGDGLRGVWEYTKDLTGNGTAKTIHGINGELFLGITHSVPYDAEGGSGSPAEDSELAWGTAIAYSSETNGPFFVGDAIHEDTATPTWKGRILAVDDNGATGTLIVDVTTGTVTNAETFTSQTTRPINAQDETSYDNSPTTEGSFVGGDGAGGTAYVASDTITLSDGTVVTVDAVNGNGDVTQFTVNSTASRGAIAGVALTQTSTSGTGTGFTLTPDVDNVSAAGATVNGTPTAVTTSGRALLLALDDDGTTGNIYLQLLAGVAPVDNSILYKGGASADVAISVTCSANATSRTIPKHFLGSYTGTLIGAYGVGVLADDLTASDTIQDLTGTTQTPPNNVSFSVTSIVSGEDYVLVGPESGGTLNVTQLALEAAPYSGGEATVTLSTAIPTDTPAAGSFRVFNGSTYVKVTYTGYSGSSFTGCSGMPAASASAYVFISYIDKLATSTSESFTAIYSTDRALFVRVRDGGGTPIKTFETPATLGSAGGSVAAIRTTDA